MATLALTHPGAEEHHRASETMLLPFDTDAGAASLAASVRFGPFIPGDPIILYADAPFHAVAGSSTIIATTAKPKFPGGLVLAMTMPDGCTHVAMITSSSACVGQAYRG
jgi:hypothetical protein